MVKKVRSTWIWQLWWTVSIPMRRMILIGVFPKLNVFASDSSWTIIKWFRIAIMALLGSQSSTRWSCIHCVWCTSLHWHALWRQIVLHYNRCEMWCRINQRMIEYIVGSSDLQRNVDGIISHSVGTNCGVSVDLWSAKVTRMRNRNLNQTFLGFLCYKVEFVYNVIGQILTFVCIHDCKGHRRDMIWYL